MANKNNTIDIIIRHHDPLREKYLSYCLMSLYNQEYENVQPIIILQNFTPPQVKNVEKIVDDFSWGTRKKPLIHNVSLNKKNKDHRSYLLNIGINLSKGRYLTFLDDDDFMYAHAYEFLIKRLQEKDVAIAFGGIYRTDVKPTDSFYFREKRFDQWKDKTIYDFFVENCFPIHSYVIDKEKIDKKHLRFDTNLSKYEDYLFLLYILSKYSSDMKGRTTYIGEYIHRNDASNTVITEYDNENPEQKKKKKHEWEESVKYTDNIKKKLMVPISAYDLARLKKQADQAKRLSFDRKKAIYTLKRYRKRIIELMEGQDTNKH
ncbi:MAG: glycosyltransferase family A protein [Alphaproteobacteria bacterium]